MSKKVIVSMEQQNKEWKVLKELTKLMLEEPSFVDQVKKYIGGEKTSHFVLKDMVNLFADPVNESEIKIVLDEEGFYRLLNSYGDFVAKIEAVSKQDALEQFKMIGIIE